MEVRILFIANIIAKMKSNFDFIVDHVTSTKKKKRGKSGHGFVLLDFEHDRSFDDQ